MSINVLYIHESYQLPFLSMSDITLSDFVFYFILETISQLAPYFPPCNLYCQQTGSHAIHPISTNISDGASCLLSSHPNHHGNSVAGVCIAGECIRLGCDKQLNSFVGFDQCGVWCGRNNTCVKINTSYIPDEVAMGTTSREG